MAVVALQTFFENLSILHELRTCKEESLSSASSSFSSTSSPSHSREGHKSEWRKEDKAHTIRTTTICFHIVCDNAMIPTTKLLRKERRKRQLKQLKEKRRRQQHRPIYNRSISVNSFASFSSSSRQPRPSRRSAAAHGHVSGKKNALNVFFNDSHVLSPISASPTLQVFQDGQENGVTTPKLSNISDHKTIMMVRRISPVSVMDVPFLSSPTPRSPDDIAGDNDSSFCETPKMRNSSSTASTSTSTSTRSSNKEYDRRFGWERGDSASSLLLDAPYLSPIVSNRKNEMVATSMSPRSARWTLLRQESDSALIRPSRTRDLLFY